MGLIGAAVPVTVFTHIKDERGTAPNHEFLIPGEGDFDYARYLRAMEPSRAAKILKEFKAPAETERVKQLIEAIRGAQADAK